MNLEDTMADTALKFGPEWLRALTEPQGGTDGGGENSDSSVTNSLHLMLILTSNSPFSCTRHSNQDILSKTNCENETLSCRLTSIGVTFRGRHVLSMNALLSNRDYVPGMFLLKLIESFDHFKTYCI